MIPYILQTVVWPLALANCEYLDSTAPSADPVAVVVLTSPTTTITSGETAQLTATLMDSEGDTLSDRVVNWASSDQAVAIVDASGLVAGLAEGAAMITATSESASGSLSITVAPPPVAQVEISPSAVSITLGNTAQLTATPRDAAGNALIGRSVSWASSDPALASVDGSGLVTGVAEGSLTVTATSEGISGTATITVTSAQGSTVDTIFYEGFESGNLNRWDDNYLAANKTVEEDQAFAFSGSWYLKILYPAGSYGGALSKFFLPGYEKVYARYYVRFPSNWQGDTKLLLLRGSRTDNVWSSFGTGGACPNGTDFFLANVVALNQPALPLRFYTYYVGMAEEPGGGVCYGRFGDSNDPGGAPDPPATYFPPLGVTKGMWHLVEFEVTVNTPGQSNGQQRFWLNGILRGEWLGLQFRTTSDLMLNVFTLESSSGDSPQTQALYVDEVLVTRERGTP